MRRTNALNRYLETLARIYSGGEDITVEWSSENPHVAIDGSHIAITPNVRDWIGKDLSNGDELRVLVDTLHHEVREWEVGHYDGKAEFMEQYPQCPKTAGAVYNILRDIYIDFTRTNDWKGMKTTRAFVVDTIFSNHHRHPRVDNLDQREDALLEGLLQLSLGGFVKGASNLDADSDVTKFLAWVEPKTREIRALDKESDRVGLCHNVMEMLLTLIDPAAAEQAASDLEMPTGAQPDPSELDFDEDALADAEMDLDDVPGGDEDDDTVEGGETGSGADDEGDDTESDDDEEGTSEGGVSIGDDPDSDSFEDLEPPGESDDADSDDDAVSDADGETGVPGSGESTPEDESETSPDSTPSGAESVASAPDVDDAPEGDGGGSVVSDPRDDVAAAQPAEDADRDGDAEDAIVEAMDAVGDRDEPSSSGDVADSFPEEEVDEDAIDAIQERDGRSSGDWYGVSDVEYETPDPHFEEKYDELEQAKNRERTDIFERKRKRDDHAERFDADRESVEETLEDTGLAQEIEEAFRELKTRDEWVPSTSGQRANIPNIIRRFSGDYGEQNLYDHKRVAEVGDRAVSVALDLSSSMPEHTAKVALLALQRAVSIIGDQFTACGYKTFNNDGFSVVTTPLITAPDEEFDVEHLGAVFAGGSTPMASGMLEARELLVECSKREEVLIVITDGKPNVTLDGSGGRGSSVIGECREIVLDAERDGVTVIGLGFGAVDEGTMEAVFGEDGYVMGTVDNLADRLIDIYYSQMDVASGAMR